MTNEQLRGVGAHIDAALAALPTNDELDRLAHPRHTDHDRHVYLPTTVAKELAAARDALKAAIDEPSDSEEHS